MAANNEANKPLKPVPTLAAKFYRTTQFLADPKGLAKDMEIRGRAEIRHNIEFYILGALNKQPGTRIDHLENTFTDDERKQWFGTDHLAYKDLTWDKCEKLLRPSRVPGAVFRVNGALEGVNSNEWFSGHSGKHGEKAIYTPRTVTLYDSKEQAIAVAKFLRIITAESGAKIIAEPIDNGSHQKRWAVIDNMNLQTHNTLRMFMTSLAHEQSTEKRKICKVQAQEEVNERLPVGEKWDVLEGVGTLLTLQGRPGVKMYKKLDTSKPEHQHVPRFKKFPVLLYRKDGADDPEDVETLKLLPEQKQPLFMRGVPIHSVIGRDGRRLFAEHDTKAVVGHALIGPPMYAALTTGGDAIGDVVNDALGEESGMKRALAADSAGGKVGGVAEVVSDLHAYAIGKAAKAIGATAAVTVTGGAMAAAMTSHEAAKHAVGLTRMAQGHKHHKPKSLVRLWRRHMEQKYYKETGDLHSMNASHHSKQWEPRDTSDAVSLRSKEVLQLFNNQGDGCETPLGLVHDTTDHSWVTKLHNEKDVGIVFDEYMQKEKRWPTPQKISDGGKHPIRIAELPQSYHDALSRLAQCQARWTVALLEKSYQPAGHSVDAKKLSGDLAEAINHFNETLRTIDRLPADAAASIRQRVREAITGGLEDFLKQQSIAVR